SSGRASPTRPRAASSRPKRVRKRARSSESSSRGTTSSSRSSSTGYQPRQAGQTRTPSLRWPASPSVKAGAVRPGSCVPQAGQANFSTSDGSIACPRQPPHPDPPPQGGREKNRDPLRKGVAVCPPPPSWGRVGVGGRKPLLRNQLTRLPEMGQDPGAVLGGDV